MSQLRELFAESWVLQAHRAYIRFLQETPDIDPIAAERMKGAFIDGFVAASRPPLSGEGLTQVVPLGVPGIIELGRTLQPFIAAFCKHGSIAPGDMMTAMALVQAMIGRQMHPSLTNRRVFEIFTQEALIVLAAMDKLQSSEKEIKH